MSITLLDGIVIVVMLISALLAMIRGFVREVLSIAAWVAAAVAAFLLYDDVLPFVQPHISQKQLALVASAGGVFVITLIIVSFGPTARTKPSFSASLRREAACATGRTAPDRLTSPK